MEKTSIIYTLSHHWSHIKSQLEMERKNWGKEKRQIGSNNYSHAVKKGRKPSKLTQYVVTFWGKKPMYLSTLSWIVPPHGQVQAAGTCTPQPQGPGHSPHSDGFHPTKPLLQTHCRSGKVSSGQQVLPAGDSCSTYCPEPSTPSWTTAPPTH